VGGIAAAINPESEAALNVERLYWVRQLVEEVRAFVHQVYVPDVIAIAALYKDWLPYGKGITNYLAVPEMILNREATAFDLPGGTIMDGDLDTTKPIDNHNSPYFRDNVAESVAHSWYESSWVLCNEISTRCREGERIKSAHFFKTFLERILQVWLI